VQLAFKLPLRSILRLQGRVTANERWTSNIPTVNLGGTLLDERHGYNLGYLLATNQEGAINPKTGEYYGHVDADTDEFVATGPIANGNVNWKNVASYFGNAYTGKTNNAMGQVTLDTEWTKWLSTSIGASTTKNKEFNRMNGSNLVAPGAGENPFPDDWAVNSNMYDYVNWRKRELLRASAMTVFNLGRVAKIQTAAGYDYDWLGTGQVDYAYFLSDPNGNIIYGSSLANLRRTTMPSMWWKVSDGPVRNALPRLGTPLIMGRDGQYYVRSEKGPKNPEWISADNPFGTANKATQAQTGGSLPSGENINASGYQWNRISIDGFWIANYTSWFDERFSTLVGARRTVTHTPITASAVGAQAPQSNNSINLGLDVRINDWLRGFYSNSSTYDNPVGFNDPMGYSPPTSKGRGQEVGLKFSPFGSKLSGSLGYYWSQASRLNTSFTNIRQQINPAGLNDYYRGPTNAGTNQWIPLDQKSSGLELILTSQITKNWSMRIAATRSDGRILETKTYRVVYNDQFWVKGADGQLGTGRGNVAYPTGEAFKVPADPSGWTMRTSNYDPSGNATNYDDWIQLTTDMMSDPNNPYYAWGEGNRPNANGQINTGLNNTDASLVGNMLRYFTSGGVKASTGNAGVPIEQIQYDWPGLTDGSATIMAARKNDYTVGYPVYKIHITSSYQFTQGFLRGFGFIITLSNGWQYRTTYYNDNADDSRNLFSRPELGWIINLNPFYERRFKHFTWRTQLNISNVFNRYEISVLPNNGTAWAVEANLRSRWDEQPRAYSWINTFTF
jgi:hypothetical protein